MALSPPPSREKLPVNQDRGQLFAEMPRAWLKWFTDVKELLAPVSSAGLLLWSQISKSGSNLTEIETRNHDDLQNLNTSSHTHLTELNHTDLTDGGNTILHKHTHNLQDGLQGGTTDEYYHLEEHEHHALLDALGTNLVSGCTLSVNADNTKFDVSAGLLYFTDSYTDPTNPAFTHLVYAGSTANSVTNLSTQDSTYITIDQNGTLYQSATKISAGDTRDKILLGALVHTNRTSITSADSNTNVIGLDIPNCLSDISYAMGIVNEGNLYSGNTTNTLRLDKSAGYFWQIGINWKNDKKSPNRIAAPASTGATHLATWRNGTGGWVTAAKTDIIPGRYDDGTGGATQPSGVLSVNKWQIIKIWYLPNSQLTGIEYGQVVYNNEADAEAAKGVPTTDNPALNALPFRGWLLVRGGATNLNNSGDAVFIDAGKFGQLTSGAGTGSSTTTLQGAYDNSTQPQITTSTTGGAVQIKRGSAADTDAVLEVLNGAGTAVTQITGQGSLYTANINLGHASDTTITRVSAGTIAVEGVNLLTTATGAALAGSASQTFSVANASSANHSVNYGQLRGGGFLRTKGGLITRDLTTASGTVATTGIGFKPKKVTFFSLVNGTIIGCHGISNGVEHVETYIADVAASNATDAIGVITIITSSGNYQVATASMDADGFSLIWTKTGSPTGTVSIAYFAEE